MVYVQRRIEQRSVAVRSFLLVVATLIGWEVEGVRGVIIATVAVIFLVAAGEVGMDIRDGRTPDPGLAVDVAPAALRVGGPRRRRWSHRSRRPRCGDGSASGPISPRIDEGHGLERHR